MHDDAIPQIRRIAAQIAGGVGREVGDAASIQILAIEDFYAFMPMHNYIFVPTRATWPGASVNSRIPPIPTIGSDGRPALDKNGNPKTISASAWLDQHRPVEQMSWAPGLPTVIRDRLLFEGGWIERPGGACFNLYLPPTITPGDATEAEPWLDHLRYIYPSDAEHILDWLAHRVQRPADKLNHALVLSGEQGIGKDSLLEPVKYAIGPWNFKEASPLQVLDKYNDFLKSVILRISEASDLGEFDRFKFYDHMKTYTAAPPDVLRVNEKHLREYPILNCCGVVITTNHKTDGIYLHPDDRRHYVAWSGLKKEDPVFQGGYWNRLWAWYASGGTRHVAAFLAQRDIGRFNPKAPPPKTEAFWAIVDANRPPEEAEISDTLDRLNWPAAITLALLQDAAPTQSFADWLGDRKSRRAVPHRLDRCGYAPVRNPDAQDGLWKIRGRRQAAYAKAALPLRDQIQAARSLTI